MELYLVTKMRLQSCAFHGDFEEEISTLPAVVEIEDEFEIAQPEPAVVAAQPTTLADEPVVAEIDIVESTSDWDMDSFDDIEVKPIVEEAEVELSYGRSR